MVTCYNIVSVSGEGKYKGKQDMAQPHLATLASVFTTAIRPNRPLSVSKTLSIFSELLVYITFVEFPGSHHQD